MHVITDRHLKVERYSLNPQSRPISFSPSPWNMPLYVRGCMPHQQSDDILMWTHIGLTARPDLIWQPTSFLNFNLYLSAFLHQELGHTSVKVKDFGHTIYLFLECFQSSISLPGEIYLNHIFCVNSDLQCSDTIYGSCSFLCPFTSDLESFFPHFLHFFFNFLHFFYNFSS